MFLPLAAMSDKNLPVVIYKKETAMKRPYSVVLADSHALVRQGVRKIIEAMGDLQVVGEAGDGVQLLEILRTILPDMVVVDISMPSLRDIEAIRQIRALYADIKVIFLSMSEHPEYLNYALNTGADGFVVKHNLDMELYPAIKKIRYGETYISPLANADQQPDG